MLPSRRPSFRQTFWPPRRDDRTPRTVTRLTGGKNDPAHAGYQYGEPPHQGASGCCPASAGHADGGCLHLVDSESRLAVWTGATACSERLPTAVGAFPRRGDVLPWDSEVAERYGSTRAAMERQGKPLPLDLLIASQALRAKAVLVTNDRAFAQVDGLRGEDWTAYAAWR